jgi:hypothetical protein
LPGKDYGVNDVNQYESEVADGNHPDQWVLCHGFGVDVKRFTSIRDQQLKVACKVDYQKQNQEQAREGHQQFSSQCAIQGLGYPAHIRFFVRSIDVWIFSVGPNLRAANIANKLTSID